jgi:hypothetical protein
MGMERPNEMAKRFRNWRPKVRIKLFRLFSVTTAPPLSHYPPHFFFFAEALPGAAFLIYVSANVRSDFNKKYTPSVIFIIRH